EIGDLYGAHFRYCPFDGLFYAGFERHRRHRAVAAGADEFQPDDVVGSDLEDLYVPAVCLQVGTDAIQGCLNAFYQAGCVCVHHALYFCSVRCHKEDYAALVPTKLAFLIEFHGSTSLRPPAFTHFVSRSAGQATPRRERTRAARVLPAIQRASSCPRSPAHIALEVSDPAKERHNIMTSSYPRRVRRCSNGCQATLRE